MLGIKGESGRFYHMPNAEALARFQAAGNLPNPLPPYKLSVWDYLIGYSLWLILLIAIPWGLFAHFKKQRAATDTAAFEKLGPSDKKLPGSPP